MMIAIKKDGEQLTKYFALHMILNSIRRVNKKFSGQYGKLIICCDAKTNWRNDEFEFYKWKRKNDIKKSDIDWKLIYECLDYVKDELYSGFPYNVIEIDNAEADDIIAVLSVYSTENKEHTVIISNDKDFLPLHNEYVCQWRPIEQAFVRHHEPNIFLRELIIRGDVSDGIPNIKSPDDVFTIDGKRQKPMYTKDVDVWKYDESNESIPEEFMDNYRRNQQLIDLSFTPKEIKDDTIKQFKLGTQKANMGKMVKFFIKHKLRYLHSKISDFC